MYFVSTVELVTTATVIEASGFAGGSGDAENPTAHDDVCNDTLFSIDITDS